MELPLPTVLVRAARGPIAAATPAVAGLKWRGLAAAALAIMAVFVAGHARHLADAPDSIDAANFVLGVRSFDVTQHQPHPPGYPVYIALGRIVQWLAPEGPSGSATSVPEARALSLLGLLFGAVAVLPLTWLFRFLDRPLASPAQALSAASVVLACPLYWFSSVRPISDVVGLAGAVFVQSVLIVAISRVWPLESAGSRASDATRVPRRLVALAALLVGLAIGVRLQSLVLTGPLLLMAVWLVARRSRDRLRWCAVIVLAFFAGVSLWLVPMGAVGLDGRDYVEVAWQQVRADFASGHMLPFHASPRALAQSIYDSLVLPWGGPGLGLVVLTLAGLGVVHLWRTGPRRLLILSVASVPYLAFHLLVQDTTYTRYALPLVPAVVWLAANGAMALTGPVAPWVLAAVAVGGVSIAATAVDEHIRAGTPANRALADIRMLAAADRGFSPVLAMHHGVWEALRGESLPLTLLTSVQGYEWQAVARHWLDGQDDVVWFLASRRRTDLAFVDAESRRLVRSYPWTFDRRPYLGAARPGGVDWYELKPPEWVVGNGWSLTPEMAGISAQERVNGVQPIDAYLRRRETSALMVLGGRVLDGGSTGARVHVALDERPLVTFSVRPGEPFLQTVHLSPGALTGTSSYARLSVRAVSASDPSRLLALSIQQFDVQSPGSWLLAFGDGWHDAEYEFESGEMWRWTSRRAALHVGTFGRDVALRLRGTVPDVHDHGITVDVRLGGRDLARFLAMDDFDIEVRLDGAALERHGGVVWLETSNGWVPAADGGSADTRELGLRVLDVELHAADVAPVYAWQASRRRHRYP
jgi:hypothetical protein